MGKNAKRFGTGQWSLAAAVAAMAILPSIGFAQTQGRVSLDMKDVDLLTACQILAKKSGIQTIIDPNATPFGKVTLHLDNVAPEDALRFVCESAGAYYTRDENGVYLLSHNKPSADSGTSAAAAAPAGAKHRRRIAVMKADPKAIYDAIAFKDGMAGHSYTHTGGHAGSDWFGDSQTPFTPQTAPPVTATSYISTGGNGVILPDAAQGGFQGG